MTDATYTPPKVWTWDTSSGGKFANINRPIAGATQDKDLASGIHPLQLHSLATPNGVKVTVMLEELLAAGVNDAQYDAYLVNIMEGAQFTSGFVDINPNSKIPAMQDNSTNPPTRIFESGAILIYLGEISGKFYNKDDRTNINQWLMVQMGYIGPMLGQHHQFHHYNPGKSDFGEERYFKISKRIYSEVDEVLSKTKFLAGDEYTIADIATFPWFARHEWHDIGIQNFKNLSRWYEEISKRDGVQKGYAFMDKSEVIPKINY